LKPCNTSGDRIEIHRVFGKREAEFLSERVLGQRAQVRRSPWHRSVSGDVAQGAILLVNFGVLVRDHPNLRLFAIGRPAAGDNLTMSATETESRNRPGKIRGYLQAGR